MKPKRNGFNKAKAAAKAADRTERRTLKARKQADRQHTKRTNYVETNKAARTAARMMAVGQMAESHNRARAEIARHQSDAAKARYDALAKYQSLINGNVDGPMVDKGSSDLTNPFEK